MLTILWLRQVQRLRGPVLWRKYKEHIAVLASLWGWARRLVFNDIVRIALLFHILLGKTKLGKR
jgi:hypothetical protein